MANYWSIGGKADSTGSKKVSPKQYTKAGLGRKASLSLKEYEDSKKRYDKLMMESQEEKTK